jgi:hypothetical protein
MKQLLTEELKLILLVVADEATLDIFISQKKLEYITFSSNKYSFFQLDITKRIWNCVVEAKTNYLNVKAQLMKELDSIQWSLKEKKKMTDLIYLIWHSEFDFSALDLLYQKIKRKTEKRIANDLIKMFRHKIQLENSSLQNAADVFFMNLPIFQKATMKNCVIGANSQIYWKSETIHENLLDLEQELRIHKEFHDIRWVLNCSLQKQFNYSEEKIKELMHNLGLELLVKQII